ncbi:hypothetical protein SAMN05216188_102135 [Lentzea xinjiangensis]|uniref:Uncharacterized protein n=1 Tax=Lentzea xinjiangensis TaxID=402600 RepID=A0A1H9DFE0_9PSEU|nr:hypothetical protein [Lentzea xinjiangensis]SEQ12200.1 hypothetical protein SAMN05216188_102135 [Lentzea xinjiangensis]
MARNLNPIQFLTNTDGNGDPVPANPAVESPAFSITKVLTAGSLVVTPIATAVAEFASGGSLQAGHYVALSLGLLGFLAIASSADVIARAISTRKSDSGTAGQRDTANLIPFDQPLPGSLIAGGTSPNVHVLAATGGSKAYFLVRRDDDALEWLPATAVSLRSR